MPDFVPDDMDQYIERARSLDRVMNSTHSEEVERCTERLVEWTLMTADALIATGLDPEEAVAGVSGVVSGILADWYAHEAYNIEDDDGEARDG